MAQLFGGGRPSSSAVYQLVKKNLDVRYIDKDEEHSWLQVSLPLGNKKGTPKRCPFLVGCSE